MITKFSEKERNRWADEGWLSSNSYYNFWGNIFSKDLDQYIRNKEVVDIGTGNGLVWENTLNKGANPSHLTMIDPDLSISEKLAGRDFISPHRSTIENVEEIIGDTIIFKQAFHLVYEKSGDRLFDLVKGKNFISFAMFPEIDWPVSDAFKEVHAPSCPDARKIIEKNGKKIIESKLYSYPVTMNREEWISMIEGRFISCLYACDDGFIENEVSWIQDNCPDIVEFKDTLECLIFR